MSPRAACRLEGLGFEQVYNYTLGIVDWKAAGLDLEGNDVMPTWVADATRPDVPVAAVHDTLGEVHEGATAAGWDEALVVDCDGIVVGRLRGSAWEKDPALQVETVMEAGPTTVRPDQELGRLVDHMQQRGTRLVVVTTPQGRLFGALTLVDAERIAAGEPAEPVWRDCEACPGRWSDV